MKEIRMLYAIGNVDEKYILEAEPKRPTSFNDGKDIERGNIMDKKIRFFGKKVSIPIVAAIAAAALAVTAGAVIYGISFIANSPLGEKQEIISELKNDIFTDENENVKLTVQEFITDGSNSIMTVRYDFLTEEGKAWGNEYLNLQKYNYYDTLVVEPSLNSDGSCPSAAWSSATVELEKYRTDTSRYFAVCVESDSVFSDSKSVELKYTLGSEPEYAAISTENRINRKWYALKSDKQASEYFTPKILCITDLSCAVYGENNGYSQSGTNDDGSFWSEVMISPEESWDLCSNLGKVSFVSNNSKTDITTSTSLCDLYADIDGCDMTILTAYIAYVDYVNDVIVHNEIDLENTNEIEICGVSYSLEEIDSPVK